MAKKTVKKVVKKTAKKKAPAAKGAPVKKKDAKVKKKVAAADGVKKKVTVKKKVKVATEARKGLPLKKKKVVKLRRNGSKQVRLKAFWGVYNQSLRRVALFEFNERKKAEDKAEELTKNGKSPHFVGPVKEEVTEG